MEKILHKKTCVSCGCEFMVTDRDEAFYKKMKIYGKYEIPDPVECWDCRQIRRLSYRNERILYKRECDLCGQNTISIYSPDKPYKIYCSGCWWGDKWDSLEYGRDFDFSRPFFDQWKELYDAVPKAALIVLGDSLNSEYTHDAYKLQNCYLTFDGEQAQDCMYGESFVMIKDLVDFLFVHRSELCYEIMYSVNCYDCSFVRFCVDCSESKFLMDCINCKNCFGCVNLRQKQYCIFNKQYSKEEYEKKIKEYDTGGFSKLSELKKQFEEFAVKQPKRAYRGVKNEDVIGDNINNCKDVYYSFDCAELRDCKYCSDMMLQGNDCMDVDIWGDKLNLAYNCECVGAGCMSLMCDYYVAFNSSDVFYSAFCWNAVKDLFGCVSLKHKQYCILNKQYSEGEYKDLFGRIVEHMKKTGEWGQFFPVATSAFGYNESVAMDFYPLSRDEALKKGYKWKEKDEKEYLPQKYLIPDHINGVEDDVSDKILVCSECGRNYKIILQELKFYRRKNITLPRKCYLCRHIDRTKFRNPRKLYDRKCDECGNLIVSPYKPGGLGIVYCESCYNKKFG